MVRFIRDEDGASIIEYGLLVGLLVVVCMTAVYQPGTSLNLLFTRVSGRVGSIAGNISTS